ncbi:hypothetical protein [Nannocystis pusilla]|uniref:hypothetical protein n=1 Tax=Nannocystis pusilla TaxID=889268 RepID=UPI003B7E5766
MHEQRAEDARELDERRLVGRPQLALQFVVHLGPGGGEHLIDEVGEEEEREQGAAGSLNADERALARGVAGRVGRVTHEGTTRQASAA